MKLVYYRVTPALTLVERNSFEYSKKQHGDKDEAWITDWQTEAEPYNWHEAKMYLLALRMES